MSETAQKLCISCMSAIPEGLDKCPVCGYDGSQRNSEPYLPIGYRLHDRYVVGRAEDFDGDTVTYVAYDWKASKAVHLKEFLPENGCGRAEESCAVIPKAGAEKHYRASLETFIKIYSKLNEMKNKSMIEVSDCFQDNNTAYVVTQLFDGISLRDFLKLKNGTLTWKQCKLLLYPVLDVLEEMHKKNIAHRGVSPENIFINRHGEIKLGGYATPAVREKGTEYQARLYAGFSATEQYTGKEEPGPKSDVYSIAAVIYRCLTGVTPQNAESRKGLDRLLSVSELNATVPQYVSNAVSLAMVVDPDGRTASIENFRHGLENEPIDNGTFFDFENISFEDKKSESEKKKPGQETKADKKGFKEAVTESRELSEQEEKTHAIVKAVMIIAAAVFGVLLLVFLIWTLWVSKSLKPPVQQSEESSYIYTVETPDFINMDINSSDFDGQGFIFVVEYMENNEIPEGIVLDQTPDSGTPVEPGSEITLFVSKHTG